MRTQTVICDICGKRPSKKNNTGNVLHWLKVDTDQYVYLYDDGSEHIKKHYDICCHCKPKFLKLFEK